MSVAKAYDLTWVTDQIAVGSAPMAYAQLEALHAAGVDCILNLCAEFCDLHWIEAGEGFETYYLPIPDEQAPDLAELEKALDWLDEAVYLGKKVLIHCRHGIGRTGTVLNAYLLRKGLGHKLAGKRLKPLRSKPQNFPQWRFVRRYGKQSGKLTIREPSLESRHLVDLTPFFADVERAVEDLDRLLERHAPHDQCGRDHARCCRRLVPMGLAEAVYTSHAVNLTLTQPERHKAMEQGAAAAKTLRKLGFKPTDGASVTPALAEAYRDEHILCPLSELGECRIFDMRPTACRMADLPERLRAAPPLSTVLQSRLGEISRHLWHAYTGQLPEGPGRVDMLTTLPDVISGKFVQSFFYLLTRNGA